MSHHTFFMAPSAWNCPFHTGAWRALEEAGISDTFRCVGGGSAGSLIAFAIAGGITMQEFDETMDRLALTWHGLRGWGHHTKVLTEVINHFIEKSTLPKWEREAFAVVTTAEWALPPLGPRIVSAPPIQDHQAIHDLVMASCYVPFLYEKVPFWNGVPALDGGVFVMDLKMPGVLNSNPWGKFGPHMIAPVPKTDGARYLQRKGWKALAPDTHHVQVMREIGYDAARTWIETYFK